MLLADDSPLVEPEATQPGRDEGAVTDIPLDASDDTASLRVASPPAAAATDTALGEGGVATQDMVNHIQGETEQGEGGGGALLSGLAGGLSSKMWGLGGSVAQQGLDLGGKAGSVGRVGLDLSSKVGSAGLGLGSMVGSGLGSATGILGKALMGSGSQGSEELPDLSFRDGGAESASLAAALADGASGSPQAAAAAPASPSADTCAPPSGPQVPGSPAAAAAPAVPAPVESSSPAGSVGFGLGSMVGSSLGSATGLLGKALMGGSSQDAAELPTLPLGEGGAATASPDAAADSGADGCALAAAGAPGSPSAEAANGAPATSAPVESSSPAGTAALGMVGSSLGSATGLIGRALMGSNSQHAEELPDLSLTEGGAQSASPTVVADVGAEGSSQAAAVAVEAPQAKEVEAPAGARAWATAEGGGASPQAAALPLEPTPVEASEGAQAAVAAEAGGVAPQAIVPPEMPAPVAALVNTQVVATAAASGSVSPQAETEMHAVAERLRAELREREAQESARTEELRSLTEKCVSLEAALNAGGQREHSAQARIQALEQQLQAVQQAAQQAQQQAAQHAQAAAQVRSEKDQLCEQVRTLEVSLETSRTQRQQEIATANGQMEQLKFALAEREKQLQERLEALTKKDSEVKSLLRQLAAVGDGGASQAQAARAPAEEEATTTFEVMFALEGALGLEFQRLAAPYVVQQVHDNGIAVGLGITPGDELVKVAEHSVTEAPWEELRRYLSQRPVVARFLRDPRRQGAEREEVGGLFEAGIAGVSKGASLLTAAIGAVPGAARAGGPGTGEAPADHQRLMAEVERLGTLLRARDEEVADLGNQIRQRDEALRVLQAGDAGLADAARLAQEAEANSQQLRRLQARLSEAERQEVELRGERDASAQRCAQEAKEKEEYRQQVNTLNERCNSLMAQFETLRGTFLNPQQKAAMEAQMQDLIRMNAQWQQAHQSKNAEAESLRQQAAERQQLQSEVESLRDLEQAFGILQTRLQEAETQLAAAVQETDQLREARMSDQGTIQRLQAVVESVQESGDSQAGFLEAELLERSRECQTLKRESDELRRQMEEMSHNQRESREALEQGRTLRAANEALTREVEASKKERDQLEGVLQRCLAKLEKEGMERPHLVDKRMVTQMLAAFLEQRDNPRQAQEIMFKMADLLGFTAQEREQAGLSQRRRTLLEQQDEPASLEELSDRFVDFLLEESEGA